MTEKGAISPCPKGQGILAQNLMNIIKYFFITLLFTLSLNAHSNAYGDGQVSYVVDGDTFDIKTTREQLNLLIQNNMVSENHVNFRNMTFRVRLANIDTEESAHRDESRNTEFGKITSNYVKSLLDGEKITYTCFEKGYYGRAICSVEINNIGDLGEHLIKEGYSEYKTDFGKHPTLHWRYRKAQATQIMNKHDIIERSKEISPNLVKNARNMLEDFISN